MVGRERADGEALSAAAIERREQKPDQAAAKKPSATSIADWMEITVASPWPLLVLFSTFLDPARTHPHRTNGCLCSLYAASGILDCSSACPAAQVFTADSMSACGYTSDIQRWRRGADRRPTWMIPSVYIAVLLELHADTSDQIG